MLASAAFRPQIARALGVLVVPLAASLLVTAVVGMVRGVTAPHLEAHHLLTLATSALVIALTILASVFINIFALASPIVMMNIYDRVLPNNAIETGWALGIGALIVFGFDFIFRTVRGALR